MARRFSVTCRSALGTFRLRFEDARLVSLDLLAVDPTPRRGRRLASQTSTKPATPAERAALRLVLNRLERYLLHKRHPMLPAHCFSFSSLTDFTRNVILAARRVQVGRTVSYTELARRMGLSPEHRRAVAQALARNPFPIFFPCHRIVAGGSIGGFSGGLGWKRRLLAHEKRRPQGAAEV